MCHFPASHSMRILQWGMPRARALTSIHLYRFRPSSSLPYAISGLSACRMPPWAFARSGKSGVAEYSSL